MPLHSARRFVLSTAAAWLIASVPSFAEEKPQAEAPRTYASLRVGASSSVLRPVMCLDVAPLSMLSVEACGTGAGFLYRGSDPELAHFRAHARLASWKTRFGWLQPRLSAGFAELQLGDDASGFSFTGVDSTGLATAGPEAGASLRALIPIGSGFEFVGDLSMNVAYLKYAPLLARPQSAWQPNAMLLVGIGF